MEGRCERIFIYTPLRKEDGGGATSANFHLRNLWSVDTHSRQSAMVMQRQR